MALENSVTDTQISSIAQFWYDLEFMTSFTYTRIGHILGPRWLETGDYYYTTAVRCRTFQNQAPSNEMVEKCREFTDELLVGRDATILIGRLPVIQLLQEKSDDLQPGDLRNHKHFGKLLALKHHAHWRQVDVDIYTSLVKNLRREI